MLSRGYVRLRRPIIIAVAGSVGKTSTKLLLGEILGSEKRVRVTDDSYNYGVGLYLSVFDFRVPKTVLGWPLLLLRVLVTYVQPAPEVIILEYGIDHPDDMQQMLKFITPDIALVTAVTPEHMEFMKTMTAVAREELSILDAVKWFGVYNADDIDDKFLKGVIGRQQIFCYGSTGSCDATYEVKSWTVAGARVELMLAAKSLGVISTSFISEPLIRQLCGAALVADKLGISHKSIAAAIELAEPAAGRMRLFAGLKGSTIIDDTANFSPAAGVAALQSLKRVAKQRRIAVLGNMHELGDYAAVGYGNVSQEFSGIDLLVLVGDQSSEIFGRLARQQGFELGSNLFVTDGALVAADVVLKLLRRGDVVLVKGPFAGFYLEETVKKLLRDDADATRLTRQSPFWQHKKQRLVAGYRR